MWHVIQGWSEGLMVTKFVQIMGLVLNMASYRGIGMTSLLFLNDFTSYTLYGL